MAAQRAPTIVVGYDGSHASRAALLYAARQTGPRGRVLVVHAYDLPPDVLGWPNYDQLLSERRGSGEKLVGELPLQSEELAGPEYELELIGGAGAEATANVARVRNAMRSESACAAGVVSGRCSAASRTKLLHIADRPVVVIPSAAIGSNP